MLDKADLNFPFLENKPVTHRVPFRIKPSVIAKYIGFQKKAVHGRTLPVGPRGYWAILLELNAEYRRTDDELQALYLKEFPQHAVRFHRSRANSRHTVGKARAKYNCGESFMKLGLPAVPSFRYNAFGEIICAKGFAVLSPEEIAAYLSDYEAKRPEHDARKRNHIARLYRHRPRKVGISGSSNRCATATQPSLSTNPHVL